MQILPTWIFYLHADNPDSTKSCIEDNRGKYFVRHLRVKSSGQEVGKWAIDKNIADTIRTATDAYKNSTEMFYQHFLCQLANKF